MASTSSFLNILTPFFPSTTTTPPPPPPQLHQHTTTPKPLSITPSKTHENSPIMAKNEGEIMGVVCPSLAYSNTLFFNAGYNVQIMVDDNEPEERLIGRFRREVMRAGVIQECKRRRHFENKQDKEKRKSREAAKRNSRRRRGSQSRGPFQNREETTKVEKKDDDGDNWEMPEGDSPF
ncbi:hypothetical protein RND81_02G153200 [Saponaria officinalis]|uniref:30S ribosomal protein S21, chloroplastic n=1 Tax=Saponaria officinalis TaxID=3572 RepID=A0AAW1MLS0_SAPOF